MDSARFKKFKMCENALVNFNVFSGESFLTSVDILEKFYFYFCLLEYFWIIT